MMIASSLALTCVVATSLPRQARAQALDDACPVRVVPQASDGAWLGAAMSAQARLRADLRPGEVAQGGDCREVIVHVANDGAVVEFSTMDGRRAIRHIDDPDELWPTIEALSITVPSALEDPPPATKLVTSAAPPASPAHDAPSEAVGRPRSEREAGVVLGVLLGGRAGWPGSYASPTVGGFAAMVVERWEIGIAAEWESHYVRNEGRVPQGFEMSGYAAGVTLGRREPLGRDLTLLFGARLGGAIVDEEGIENGSVGGSQGEARAGVHVGLLFPTTSAFRFRSVLAGDGVPSRFGHSATIDTGLPSLPRWMLSLAVGLETEAL